MSEEWWRRAIALLLHRWMPSGKIPFYIVRRRLKTDRVMFHMKWRRKVIILLLAISNIEQYT